MPQVIAPEVQAAADKVTEALREHGPLSRPQIEQTTGMNGAQLSRGLGHLVTKRSISARSVYYLPEHHFE